MPRRKFRATTQRRGATAGATREIAREVLDGVRRLDRGLRIAARRVERATGLSAAQLFVLQHLAQSPAESLNELAARTFTDRSSVSAVVDRLDKAGLVTREVSPRDRRQFHVRINGRGLRKLSMAPPAPTDLLLHGIGRLPRSNAKRLGQALAALNAALGFEETEFLFENDGVSARAGRKPTR